MASQLNTQTYTIRAGLTGDAVVEFHHNIEGDLGRSLFWEQRYFLQHFHYLNGVEFRKREARARHLELLVMHWGLSSSDVVHGDTRLPDAIGTRCLNSRALLPWCFQVFRKIEKANSLEGRSDSVDSTVCAIYRIANEGCGSIEDRPSVTVFGFELQVGIDMCVDIRPLLTYYPGLVEDWSSLICHSNTCGLRPITEPDKVHLGRLASFLEARIHYSDGSLDADHWMRSFSKGINTIITFLFEIGIQNVLAGAHEKPEQPQALFGTD